LLTNNGQGKYEYAPFYKNALLFLACVDIDDLPTNEKRMRAYDLAIAALVSDTIYNFGELLLHDILSSLQGTEKSWVRDLLFAFNRGDLKAYDQLSPKIKEDGFLSQYQHQLYQKLALAALTETVFKRPPHDRAMTFAAISAETKIKGDEIEYMVMKALSLGLVRGSIDQVAEVAKINWVQPKVLDKGQIVGMRTRLKEWDGSVHRLGTWIEQKGQDVWAA
jgi:26S proteasome regulatory subunit N9